MNLILAVSPALVGWHIVLSSPFFLDSILLQIMALLLLWFRQDEICLILVWLTAGLCFLTAPAPIQILIYLLVLSRI
jgi:hypothetical protein